MAEEKSPLTSVDPTDFARVFAEIALRSKHLVETRLKEQAMHAGEEPSDELGVGKAFSELAGKLMSDPFKLADMSLRMWRDYFTLWQNTVLKASGGEPAAVAEPGKSDNRFKSELWQNNLLFDYIKQSYLIAAQNIQKSVSEVDAPHVFPTIKTRSYEFFVYNKNKQLFTTRRRYFIDWNPMQFSTVFAIDRSVV